MQTLNKMLTELKQSGTQSNDSLLKESEGYSQMIWLPVDSGQVNLDEVSVQVETGKSSKFQNEKLPVWIAPKSGQSIFADIAKALISKYSESNSPAASQLQNNNANAAKADTKE